MDLDLSRVRRPSRRFGWIDRRIVTDGHLADLGPTDVSVYLVLCLVADRHGVSWLPTGRCRRGSSIRRAMSGTRWTRWRAGT